MRVARHLAQVVPTTLGALVLVFLMLRVLPGDPATAMLGTNATPQAVTDLQAQLGLDRPLWVQFVDYIGGLARLDLGRSLALRTPVSVLVAQALVPTLLLTLGGSLVSVVVGVPLGIMAALRRATWVDYLASVGALLGISVPVFVWGLLLLLAFTLQWPVLPSSGAGANPVEVLRALILPSIATGFFQVGLVVLIGVLAVGVGWLPLPDPTDQSVLARLKPPSAEHLFGTDRLGRDVLSRVLWAARLSLVVGVGVVFVSGLLGTLVGVVAGYFHGWPSTVLLRLTDILLAFPPLILAMVTVTVLGNSVLTVVLAISVGLVPRFARVARGTILAIREREYVEAARAMGASTTWVILRHVLLNAVDPLIVLCTLQIPGAILTEALLSFLGLGITEPNPTWGNMINGGQLVLREAAWVVLFPSAAIVLTVLAFNLLGDAIRDALDPNVREVRMPAER